VREPEHARALVRVVHLAVGAESVVIAELRGPKAGEQLDVVIAERIRQVVQPEIAERLRFIARIDRRRFRESELHPARAIAPGRDRVRHFDEIRLARIGVREVDAHHIADVDDGRVEPGNRDILVGRKPRLFLARDDAPVGPRECEPRHARRVVPVSNVRADHQRNVANRFHERFGIDVDVVHFRAGAHGHVQRDDARAQRVVDDLLHDRFEQRALFLRRVHFPRADHRVDDERALVAQVERDFVLVAREFDVVVLPDERFDEIGQHRRGPFGRDRDRQADAVPLNEKWRVRHGDLIDRRAANGRSHRNAAIFARERDRAGTDGLVAVLRPCRAREPIRAVPIGDVTIHAVLIEQLAFAREPKPARRG
jgi:hypothetical protein